MADETRRSGRATKGQYTKDRDVVAEAPSKRKANGKDKGSKANANAAAEDEDGGEDVIRCVCGQYEEEEETERAMICCDSCDAWQHNDCMGLPTENYSPAKYFCEQCKPENHKKLLTAIKKGEKPWEETTRRREAAAEAELAKKKGGGKKGGRKSGARASEVAPRASQEVEDRDTPASARGGQKRKMEDSSAERDVKGAKKARSSETPSDAKNGTSAPPISRKISTMGTPQRQFSRSEMSYGPAAASLNELSSTQRKQAATQLSKLFVDQAKEAIEKGAYTLPQGVNVESVGSELGLNVEHALYHFQSQGNGEPNDAYKNQMRTIVFNIKRNSDLRDRLLNSELSPHAIAAMDSEDMATENQQKRDAAMKKELEKQHTIIQEQGPRIRRTHKGEEYVDESHQIAQESTTSHAPPRRQSTMDQTKDEPKSPSTTFGTGDSIATAARPMSQASRSRPSIDTQRRSSTNFDIDNVWSTVQGSPDATQTRFPELNQQSPPGRIQESAGPGTREDAEVDALLKDEDAESEPYSPKNYEEADSVVWRGSINGNEIGKFTGAAKYVAGVSLMTLNVTSEELIPREIVIGGRIDPMKADEYLCGLQYSNTSDVVVLSITEPVENAYEQKEFNRLFAYFKDRKRYGVGVQQTNPAIKDIYIIPLEVGDEPPTLLILLDGHKIGNPVSEKMFLIPIVIKNTELRLRGGEGPSPDTPVQQTATPITPYEPYAPPTNGMAGGPLPYPPPQAFAPPSIGYPSPAAVAAQKILGHELSRTPAVLQLIAQAPTAGEPEMNVVKDCLMENPAAAQNLAALTTMLERRMYPNGPEGGAPNIG